MGHAPNDAIDEFYSLIKAGTCVGELLRQYTALFPFIHSMGLTPDYRLGKGRLKRLFDEVTPVTRVVRRCAGLDDRIQFPLNSSVPDCNLWHRSGRHQTIEVTTVHRRAHFFLMKELNATGQGRGYLGLDDSSSNEDFRSAMNREREMHSTPEAQASKARAIASCARKKSNNQSAETLIIEDLMLNCLPTNRCLEMQYRLSELVQPLLFSEIYLVGYHNDDDLCLRLK